MNKMILILIALITLFLFSCAPQLTYVDGKKTRAAIGTDPQEIRALSQAEMRHSVSTLGQQIAGIYQLINQQYQQLLEQGPDPSDSTGVIYRQKLAVLQQMMTFSLSSLETYGRVYAQPDDDKIRKEVRTSHNLTAGVVGNNSTNQNSYSSYNELSGFYYHNGMYYADYDKEMINPIDVLSAKVISRYPNGSAAKTFYLKYLRKKTKLQKNK